MSVLRELLHVADLVVEEVDPRALTNEQIAEMNAWENRMLAEARPEDPPEPIEMTTAIVRDAPSFVARREFWARDGSGAIGASATVVWREIEANRHLVRVWIGVRPDLRRRGIGTALLRVAADTAEAQGRDLLSGTTIDREPAGEAFARRMGAELAIETHTNRLLLEKVDRDQVRAWVEQGPLRAEEYTLVAIDGRYPDELAEDIVATHDIMNTAPRENLRQEDEHYTVDQMRERESQLFAMNGERWSLFARHVPSGELIGLTEVAWFPTMPETVWQWATAVRPDHRGHALGKWLKASMLLRVFDERPGAVDVRTGNADSNEAMLGINHGLGFEPYIAELGWQIPLDAVRAYLSGSST